MRMRDQLIVTIAIAVATVAVAGNALAQTRAADRRVEIEQAGLAAAWSYPVMAATTSTLPAESDDAQAHHQAAGDSGTDSAEAPATSDDPATSCSGRRQCASEEGPSRDFMNHGRMVAGYVHALGFEEGVDGPRGAYIRQVARPDIENDGPPRSERADENTPPGQDNKAENTPPGQDNKAENTPPGQDKKDADG